MLTSLNLALTRCILQVCSVLKLVLTMLQATCCLHPTIGARDGQVTSCSVRLEIDRILLI